MFAAAAFWGSSATLARFAFRDRHVPPLVAVEMRLALATSILGLFLLFARRSALRIDRRDLGYFIVLAAFGMAAVQGSYYYSIAVLGVGLAILIQYLAPSLLVAIDWMRGTHVEGRTLIAVLAALAGTALLVGSVETRALKATPLQWAVSFSAALSFAFYIAWSKRGLTRYPPETVLFHSFWMAALLWAFVTPPWNVIAAGYDAEVWWLFLALAVFSTLVPFFLFNAGLRRLRATEAGILSTLEPVVALVSAALFLGESLSLHQNLGAVLVLIGAALSSSAKSSSPPKP